MKSTIAIAGLMAGVLSGPAFSQSSSVVGFDGGTDGGFTGNAFFEATGGNPDGNAHHFLTAFFMVLRTGGVGEPANASFLGDYSSFDQVTFAFDVKVHSITDFIGNPIAREIGIALIDRDIQGPSGPSGVFFTLAALSSAGQPDWTHLSVTIDDPTSTTLPAGWVGFGDEDPNTFEPILPAGASFATVLAGVDEFHVSGAIPGFFFNNANFDVRIDNVAVSVCDNVTTYCTTKQGLACGPPSIGATGEPSATKTTGFVIEAGPARSDRTGVLMYSNTGRAALPFPAGGHILCIQVPVRRGGPVDSGGTPGANCDGVFALDMNEFASGNYAPGFPTYSPAAFLAMPGQQVNCQWWGRDTQGTGSFMSDALEYMVCP